MLFRFQTADDLERWHVSTDAYFGGRSRASLDLAAASGGAETQRQQPPASAATAAAAFATFSGRCSTAPTLAQVEEQQQLRAAEEKERAPREGRRREGGEEDDDGGVPVEANQKKPKKKRRQIAHTSSNAEIARAGYAVAASKVLDLGDPFDLSAYSHLVCAVRGDGGRYLATLRTDSLSGGGGDVWQAPFSAPRGVWADVRLPLAAFALTHRGQLVGRRVALRADRVLSVGVSFAAAGQDDHERRGRAAAAGRPGEETEGGGDDERSGDGDGDKDDDADDDRGLTFRLDLREIRAEQVDDADLY